MNKFKFQLTVAMQGGGERALCMPLYFLISSLIHEKSGNQSRRCLLVSPGKLNMFMFTVKMPSLFKHFIEALHKHELEALDAEQGILQKRCKIISHV